jgi:hypothetical protein
MRFAVRWLGRAIVTVVAFLAVGLIAGSALTTNGAVSSPRGDSAAIAGCLAVKPIASQYGSITALLRGETSSAAAVANWQEHRGRNVNASRFRTMPGAAIVTVCLFSGQFSTPAGPPALNGVPKALPTVLRLLVYGNGQVEFDSAGPEGSMSPETPSDLSA